MFYWFPLNPLQVKKPIDAQTKLELNIPQLTLAKIAQLGKHETVNTRSEHYSPGLEATIPVRSNFFAEFILL